MFFSGSGFRDKTFLSLAHIPDPGRVSFTGSGFRVRMLRDCSMATDLLGSGSLMGEFF